MELNRGCSKEKKIEVQIAHEEIARRDRRSQSEAMSTVRRLRRPTQGLSRVRSL